MVRQTTISLYWLSALSLLVFLLLAGQPSLTAKSSFDNYEQPSLMSIESLDNEPKGTNYIVVKVSDFGAGLPNGVGLQERYQGRTQDEPVLVDVWPEYQFRQELLPRPPPK
jgi:hypothetical protein